MNATVTEKTIIKTKETIVTKMTEDHTEEENATLVASAIFSAVVITKTIKQKALTATVSAFCCQLIYNSHQST